MFGDGFGIMLSKFSDDARREIARRKRDEHLLKQQRLVAAYAQELAKRVLLGIAVIGVALGLYYGHALGKMMGELRYSSSAETDPTLRGAPTPNAKEVRRMKEMREKRDADLNEVDQFLGGAVTDDTQ